LPAKRGASGEYGVELADVFAGKRAPTSHVINRNVSAPPLIRPLRHPPSSNLQSPSPGNPRFQPNEARFFVTICAITSA